MCVWLSGKESTWQSRRLGFNPWVRRIPWRRKWLPIPVFLPGKSHGHRSLAGYIPISSVAQSCLTLCDPMDCSTPGLPVHYQLPELTQTHVHWVGDAIQPSHPLSSPFLPAFGLSQHQGLFQWVSSSQQVAKVLEFQLQHQYFQWLDRLAVQGTLKSLLQHHSLKASILQHSAFFTVQLSHPHMTTGKTIALTGRAFVGKVMSLLFNMLSRLVITFLPRNKRLLISWLQSPSAFWIVNLHCDFGAQKNKVWHCFPIYFPWSDGTGCHDLSFLNVKL